MIEKNGGTITFSIPSGEKKSTKETLAEVYKALLEKGYNPIDQIIGYIITDDPTYITNHNGARSKICRIERNDLLREIVESYLGFRK